MRETPAQTSECTHPSPRAFRAVWTQNLYAQQQCSVPNAEFTGYVNKWYEASAKASQRNRSKLHIIGNLTVQRLILYVCVVIGEKTHVHPCDPRSLTDGEMALLVSGERRNISRLRQLRAGISDAEMAYRDAEVEPFLQPLLEPNAWPEYYAMGDPVVSPESDEELEEQEEVEVEVEDVPREPSWVHIEFVPRVFEGKLRQIFSKGRTLIRAPRLQLEGHFTGISSEVRGSRAVFCLRSCEKEVGLLVVVAGPVWDNTEDSLSLETWATHVCRMYGA